MESIGWDRPQEFDESSTDLTDGKLFKSLLESAEHATQERVNRDLGDCERLAKGGFTAVLWPACGDDAELRNSIEALRSNRARALCLFLHNKPDDDLSQVFRRAETLLDCGAAKPGGRSWKLYQLKSFARDWTPATGLEAKVKEVVSDVLTSLGEPKRYIETEITTRPSHPGAGDGDFCYTLIINISGATESEERWEGDSLGRRPKTPNRKIVLCVSPVSKGFDCGWHVANAALANEILNQVARDCLNQSEDPEPIKAVPVTLDRLFQRPTWVCPPESGISSVQVKKLVVSQGPGTRTYYVSAKSRADAYDVAPRNIPPSRIIAANLRVEFEKGLYGTRKKAVSFDLAVPNRCTLRETSQPEAFILNQCLREWGLIEADDEEDRPLLLKASDSPLSDLLSYNPFGASRAEVETTFGHNLKALLQQGILTKVDEGNTALCPECREPHPVDLFSSEKGVLIHCPVAGLIPVPASEIERFTCDLRALAAAMYSALPLEDWEPRIIDDETLVYLGTGRGKVAWPVMFAFKTQTQIEINKLIDRLSLENELKNGVVICGAEMPKRLALPNRHRVASIDELFALKGGSLTLNERRLSQLLNRKNPPKRPGRPSPKTLAERFAEVRRRLNTQAVSPDQELEAIKVMLRQAEPDVSLPADEQIRYVWLKDHFAQLNFRET